MCARCFDGVESAPPPERRTPGVEARRSGQTEFPPCRLPSPRGRGWGEAEPVVADRGVAYCAALGRRRANPELSGCWPMRLEELPPVNGVRHRTVSVNGIDMHVAEAGDGPPLLLVHGWPQHWWCWRHLIPALSQRYRVLAPDLRGMGWSSAPEGPYDKQTFADDLLALLDAEGIERTRIIGHDWGGYASFLLALGHPERVERLVGLDIPPPWRTP